MGKHPIAENVKEEIVRLRKHGHSVPEIHRILGISKSTALRYVQNVDILPEFRNRWLERRNASRIISEKAWDTANEFSKRHIVSLTDKDLKIIGATLYWAEGAKREFSFINSDPEMIRLIIKILIEAYEVPKSSIKISLRLFEDINAPEAIKFWSKVTGLELPNNIFIETKKRPNFIIKEKSLD